MQRQPELPDPLGDFFEGSWLTDAPLGHAPQVSIDYPVAVNSHHQAVSRPSGGGVPTIAGTAQGAARLVPRGDDYLQWSSVASQAGPRHVLDIKRSASGDSYDHLRDLIKEGRLNEARTEVRRSLRKSIKEQSQNYDESLDDSSKEGALKESLEAIDEYIAIVKKLDLYKQKGSNDKNTEPKTLFLDIQKKESSITDFGGAMIAYINARENLERRRPGIVSHAAQPAAAAAASPSYPDLSNVTAMEGSYSEAYLAASSAYYQPPQRGASGKRARMGDGNPQQDYCSQSQGLDYSLPHIPDSPIVPSSTYGPDPAGAYFSTFNERASAASPTVSPGLEMEGQQENPGDLDFLEQLLFQQIDKGSQGSR